MLSSEVDTYKEALNEILKTIQGDTYVAMPTNPSQMGKNSEKATGSSVVIGSSPHSAKKSLPIWIAGSVRHSWIIYFSSSGVYTANSSIII